MAGRLGGGSHHPRPIKISLGRPQTLAHPGLGSQDHWAFPPSSLGPEVPLQPPWALFLLSASQRQGVQRLS